MIPIWKDTTYTGLSASTICIKVDDDTIYEGNIVPYPDGTSEININNICREYLDSDLPDFRDFTDSAVTQDNAYRNFGLYSGNTLLNSYQFLNDWSYENNSSVDMTLSKPINGHMDSRMKLFYTVFRNNSGTICWV